MAQQATKGSFCTLLTGVGVVLDGNDGRPMKDIWDKFYETLLLSLPLLEAQAASQPELITQMERDTERLIQSLKQEDSKTFSDTLKHFMLLSESTVKQLYSQI